MGAKYAFALTVITTIATGCSGISDCKEDVTACTEMVAANPEKCAQSYILVQSDKKRKACEKAIKMLGKAGAKGAVPGLLAVLAVPEATSHPDKHQLEAAKALGKIGDPAAVDGLIAAMDFTAGTSSEPKDKNANRSNEEIAKALGLLGDKKAVPKLLELMNKTRDRNVVLKVVRALGRLGDAKAVAPLSEMALTHDNKFLRKNAVIALGDIGDAGATDPLIRMMFVEFKGVSFYKEASFALYKIGPDVAQPLLDTMAGKNEGVNKIFEKSGGVKDTAIKAKCGYVLGDLRDPRAVDPLIEAFTSAVKNNDPVVQGFAPAPMAALGDAKAVPVLRKQALTLAPSIRAAVMRALVQLGDTQAVPEMIKGMKYDWMLGECKKIASEEACKADSNLYASIKEAVDNVTNLAQAEHAETIKAAIAAEPQKAMQEYMNKRFKRVEAAVECKEDAGCWAKKLDDSEPLVRERAAWTLGRLKDKSTIDALAKALGDKKPNARSAAIMSYWTYGDKRAVDAIKARLEAESSSADFIKVNEDLKRLLVYLQRS